jgi:hypothetical protein
MILMRADGLFEGVALLVKSYPLGISSIHFHFLLSLNSPSAGKM